VFDIVKLGIGRSARQRFDATASALPQDGGSAAPAGVAAISREAALRINRTLFMTYSNASDAHELRTSSVSGAVQVQAIKTS
jgi:hypothetical protein